MKFKIFNSFCLVLFLSLFFFVFSIDSNAQEINTECKGVYSDVALDNKMCPYTEYLYHQNVASGSNGNFMPDEGINRGQVAKIIMNAFQIPEDLSGDEFPDVSSSHTFYKHIMSLKNAGVLSGYPDGEFKPDNEVTRAQMMKLVINAMNFPETGIISTGHDGMAMQKFSDLHSNHSLFRFVGSAYIATVNEEENKKIIKGYPDGTFKPDQSMKRAEVAKVVTNSMKFGEFENVSCSEWFCQDKFEGSIKSKMMFEHEEVKKMIDDDALLGNTKMAKAVMIEFGDYECPFCKKFFDDTLPDIKKDFIDSGKLVYTFRDLPLDFHTKAQIQAEAAECAGEQGNYFEMHDLIYRNGGQLTSSELKGLASELSLSSSVFSSCLDGAKMEDETSFDANHAATLGINGTPGFALISINTNGEMVGTYIAGAQAYDNFKTEIEGILSNPNDYKVINADSKIYTPEPGEYQVSPNNDDPTIVTTSVHDDEVKGNRDLAKVGIIEFSDYSCPFCQRFTQNTLPSILENYVDTNKAIFVFRDLPLASLHLNAQIQAEAAECAGEQGKYYEMHDKIYAGDNLNTDTYKLKTYASDLGLNRSTFDQCLDNGEMTSEVDYDANEAARIGIAGTPGFVVGTLNSDGSVNGEIVSGAQPYSEFERVINKYL